MICCDKISNIIKSKKLIKIQKKKSLEKLDKTINELIKHNFFKVHRSFWYIILISLFRGLASGLGWVLGATILVSLLTYFLSQIEFIPILGELVSKLIEEIEGFDR